MTHSNAQVQSAVEPLLQMDDAELYAELGTRLQVATTDLSKSTAFALAPGDRQSTLESGMDFEGLGKRFFDNISASAYNVICGSAEGHDKVKQVQDLGEAAVTASIATLLVSSLGLMAVVAAAVAAIIVRVFAKGATDTLCQTWKESLPPTPDNA